MCKWLDCHIITKSLLYKLRKRGIIAKSLLLDHNIIAKLLRLQNIYTYLNISKTAYFYIHAVYQTIMQINSRPTKLHILRGDHWRYNEVMEEDKNKDYNQDFAIFINFKVH
ncbi:MAG: hypothetical protein RR348_02125, partial [Clostridia bacterium]